MPKARLTEQQERERALKRAIARAKVDLDLDGWPDVADYIGMPRSTCYRKAEEPYHGFGFGEAARLARKLGFTGRELCAIFGIPYDQKGAVS